MTTVYFVSNQASNDFVVGDDSNDGLSKSAPFLTADQAFTAAALLDDVELIFNDGSYEYTLNNGQYTLPATTTYFSIDCVSDWQTLITMNGSNDVKFAHDWSAADDAECALNFGRVLFGSNTSAGFTLFSINKQNDLSYLDFRSGARMLLSDGLSNVQILSYNCANRANYYFYDCGFCGLGQSYLNVPGTTLASLFSLTDDVDIDEYLSVTIHKFFVNLRCIVLGTLIELGQQSLNPSGVLRVVHLTGKLRCVDDGTVRDLTLVKINNQVTSNIISGSRQLTVELEDPDSSLTGFTMNRAAGLETTYSATIGANTLNCQAQQGNGVLIGQEVSASISAACASGNRISNVLVTDAQANAFYGVMLADLDSEQASFISANQTRGCEVHYTVDNTLARVGYNLANGDGSLLYQDINTLAGTFFGHNVSLITDAFTGSDTLQSSAEFADNVQLTPLTAKVTDSQPVTITVAGAENLTDVNVHLFNRYMQPLFSVQGAVFNASGELTLELAGVYAQSGETLYYKVDDHTQGTAALYGAQGVLTMP